MKRFFTSAALACAMLAAGPSRGEEPPPPESRPEITLRIDAEGHLLRTAEAVSGSGPKEAPQSWAGVTWKDLGCLIEHSQSRKPAAASRPDAPLAAAPSRRIRVVLRWEADKRRCRIAQEGSTVQYDGKGMLGEGHREKWEPRLMRALVPNQVDSGCARGSWDPVDAWGTAVGRVYATAMSALALECLLRYRRDLVLK